VDATDAAQRWADTWKRAWEAQDTEAIVELYHPDVVFSTQPFREPYLRRAGVREYVSQAFSEEEEVRVWVGEPVVGADRAAIEWWAALRENGVEITLAGTSVLALMRTDWWSSSATRGTRLRAGGNRRRAGAASPTRADRSRAGRPDVTRKLSRGGPMIGPWLGPRRTRIGYPQGSAFSTRRGTFPRPMAWFGLVAKLARRQSWHRHEHGQAGTPGRRG
jgi:hypothetical protein